MTRKRNTSRKCLAHRCGKLVEPPDIFCRDHWDQLPELLREAIWNAILQGKRDETVAFVTEAYRYLNDYNMPRRRSGSDQDRS
jgi:hypothetical protein